MQLYLKLKLFSQMDSKGKEQEDLHGLAAWHTEQSQQMYVSLAT